MERINDRISSQMAGALVRNNPTLEKSRMDVLREFQETAKEVARDEARNAVKDITERMHEVSERAMDRIESLIDSEDEQVATRNAQYVIDHTLGKPMQKSMTQVTHITIDTIAD